MIKREIEITNKLGLHARAAAKLSHLANTFNSDIFLIYDQDKVNAKSLLGILTMAASIGNNITIVAKGKDEEKAIKKITELFHNKFNEEN
jgi:phosphocarrier protein